MEYSILSFNLATTTHTRSIQIDKPECGPSSLWNCCSFWSCTLHATRNANRTSITCTCEMAENLNARFVIDHIYSTIHTIFNNYSLFISHILYRMNWLIVSLFDFKHVAVVLVSFHLFFHTPLHIVMYEFGYFDVGIHYIHRIEMIFYCDRWQIW